MTSLGLKFHPFTGNLTVSIHESQTVVKSAEVNKYSLLDHNIYNTGALDWVDWPIKQANYKAILIRNPFLNSR